jgi:hypothetical protein
VDHHADAEAARQAPSYAVAAGYYLWYQRGSATFVNLGVHDHPPPAELDAYIESKRVDEAVDFFTTGGEERALRAAFFIKKSIDRLDLPDVWPW